MYINKGDGKFLKTPNALPHEANLVHDVLNRGVTQTSTNKHWLREQPLTLEVSWLSSGFRKQLVGRPVPYCTHLYFSYAWRRHCPPTLEEKAGVWSLKGSISQTPYL